MSATTTPAPAAAPGRIPARAWALLLALSVLWGGSFLFIGVAVREWPPVAVIMARLGLAALGLLALLRASGERFPAGRGALLTLGVLGALNCALPFTLIALGQRHVPAGLAAILNATTPLFGALVAHALTTDERLTPARLAGVLTGFAGVALLVGGPGSGETPLVPVLCCLGASLCYAFGAVWTRRVRALRLTPLATATGQVALGAAALAPVALVLAPPWTLPPPSVGAAASLVALALLSTTLAYVVFFRVVALAGPGNVLLVTFLVPPSAILLGWAVLGEALLWRHLAGLAVIAAGLALIDGRALSVLRRGRAADV